MVMLLESIKQQNALCKKNGTAERKSTMLQKFTFKTFVTVHSGTTQPPAFNCFTVLCVPPTWHYKLGVGWGVIFLYIYIYDQPHGLMVSVSDY
jgi:hypothetical protein